MIEDLFGSMPVRADDLVVDCLGIGQQPSVAILGYCLSGYVRLFGNDGRYDIPFN